jgi:hypothetical protein
LTSDKEAVMRVVVSLIRHAHDATTPADTSWLLAGAVATGLLALVLTEQALGDAERISLVFHPLRLALAAGAATALIVGWLRPSPWLLALLLVAILSAGAYVASVTLHVLEDATLITTLPIFWPVST